MAALELVRTSEDSDRPPLFLGQKDVCLFIGDQGAFQRPIHGPISIDHLVPNMAARKHKRLLGDIHLRKENQVCLCGGSGGCHRKIDHHPTFGKLKLYREFGLPGLVQDLAAFPRAIEPELYVLQYHQFRALFGLLAKSFDQVLRDNKVPKHWMREYTSSRDIIAYHLYQWEAYNFDIKAPALDLLLQAW